MEAHMIASYEDAEIVASVNTWTGYPTVCNVCDDTFSRMVTLLAFVETSPYNVMENSAFWRMKALVEQGGFMCRGAHAFRFWFNNRETAELFYRAYGGELEVPPILPTRR
jgi:hypothetical protein